MRYEIVFYLVINNRVFYILFYYYISQREMSKYKESIYISYYPKLLNGSLV